MKSRKKVLFVMLALMLAFGAFGFTGCGSAAPSGGGDNPEPEVQEAVHVDSVEALLAAIEPGAEIVIERGKYNLCTFLDNYPNVRDCDEWNEEHDYVKLYNVYDGVEIHITDADNIKISGISDNPAQTEIVTEPRYASVLYFYDCDNVELNGLTLGHTDTGDCSGNVIDFETCNNIILKNMDLYGCGVNGIGTSAGTGELFVYDSVIRDCEYSSIEVYEPFGEYYFERCKFTGSGWGGYFEYNDNTSLKFVECTFGDNETNSWFYEDRAEFEDCTWAEVTLYPEYPDYSDYDYDDISPAADYDGPVG
jgi:hypothetical protein